MATALLSIDLAKPVCTCARRTIREGVANAGGGMNGWSVPRIGWGILFKNFLPDWEVLVA